MHPSWQLQQLHVACRGPSCACHRHLLVHVAHAARGPDAAPCSSQVRGSTPSKLSLLQRRCRLSPAWGCDVRQLSCLRQGSSTFLPLPASQHPASRHKDKPPFWKGDPLSKPLPVLAPCPPCRWPPSLRHLPLPWPRCRPHLDAVHPQCSTYTAGRPCPPRPCWPAGGAPPRKRRTSSPSSTCTASRGTASGRHAVHLGQGRGRCRTSEGQVQGGGDVVDHNTYRWGTRVFERTLDAFQKETLGA